MSKETTVISKAEIIDTISPNRSGTFKANVAALPASETTINYTSPFGTNGEGGFLAIPLQSVPILVCQPAGETEWYYLGSTFVSSPGQEEGDKIPDATLNSMEQADPNLYRARGVPMRQSFRGPRGGGISIEEEYNPKFFNLKTELKSAGASKVSVNNSPEIDSIIIDSGNGSKITVASNPKTSGVASKSVQIETKGPQKYINTESQTDIVVKEAGRELQFLNYGTGEGGAEGITEAGNVNIQSAYKDVNVFSRAATGRIFIECIKEDGQNQLIQIETNGTDGAIVIKTQGDIRMAAGGNIDLSAGQQIRMSSGGKYSISSDTVDIQTAGTTSIDAPDIQLANGANPSPPSTEGQQSTYGNEGITTY